LALLEDKLAMEARDERVINLGIGISGFDVRERLRLDGIGLLDGAGAYAPTMGAQALRHELAAFLAQRFPGASVDPGRIAVCDGGSNALLLAVALLASGDDEILIPRVHYPALRSIVERTGARVRFVACDERGKVDPQAVAAAATHRTRALILTTPSNPFGSSYDREELEALARVGLPLISDEVYNGLEPGMPSALQVAGASYVVGSFSKTFALPGLRVGFLCVPADRVGAVRELRMCLNIATTGVAQEVATAALRQHEELLRTHAAFLRAKLGRALDEARSHGLSLVSEKVDGAFFLALKIDDLPMSSDEASRLLLRRDGVMTIPGTEFTAGFDPRFLRLNFTASDVDLTDGFARLARFVHWAKRAA
jgi:aspartate/methionine/tyrosine aminotransferase